MDHWRAGTWAAATLVLILLSCTASHAGAPPPALPTPQEAVAAEAQYVAIVAPEVTAIERFAAAAAALPPGASVDDFVVLARPFADTITAVDKGLRGATWPAVLLHDIKAELGADDSLKADLIGTLDVTLIIDLWRHQVFAAANKVIRIQRTVRMDLGPAADRPAASAGEGA